MVVLFWLSIIMIFYAYFGYPLCLLIISFFKNSADQGPNNSKLIIKNSEFPTVSFIITAYNEESRIEEKIEGSLAQDYPQDKLEIIIASDCSADRTDEIVQSYADRGVRLVRAPERKGKENAQKHAVEASTGEILVFSDVATILKPDGITTIVNNFSDPSIGCVSSEDKFMDPDGTISGEGAYVKYEMFLRGLESKVNTLVGLSGSFFAARREVCENWVIDLQSDFNTLLNSIRLGKRGISDSHSHGYYKNIADEGKEFNRKVRTVLRGISVLMRNLSLLSPLRYGLFSWQLFSHKLCRWMVPFFMISALLSNTIIMFSSLYYFLTFLTQAAFYFLAFKHYRKDTSESGPNSKLVSVLDQVSKLSYFFITVNTSIIVAWWKFLKGERATFWEPSKR